MTGGVQQLYDDMLADSAASSQRPPRPRRKDAKVSDVYVEERGDRQDTKVLHHVSGPVIVGVMKYNRLTSSAVSPEGGERAVEDDRVVRLLQVG
jgi:hypothetical protein